MDIGGDRDGLQYEKTVKEDLANLITPLMLRPITRWPFFAFLGGAMFCLLESSTCHLFSCHSERLSYIILRLDYAGIAVLISTSFYSPVYYSFVCDPFFDNLYLGFITILGIASVIVSLLPKNVKEDLANLIAPLMLRPITRWPLFTFLGGAMFCLLESNTCHLFSFHSNCLSYIMLRLDYAGIAALISTSFYSPVYYSFVCDPFFCNLYLGFITVLGIASVIVSLLPVFQTPEF